MKDPQKKSLRFLIANKRWIEAYFYLINTANNPPRYLSGDFPGPRYLLSVVCCEPAPTHLIDLVASSFPQDIIGECAIYSVVSSTGDTRAETVRILLKHLRKYLIDISWSLEDFLCYDSRDRTAKFRNSYRDSCKVCDDMETLKVLVEACPMVLLERSRIQKGR
jgi:hypothetical protein